MRRMIQVGAGLLLMVAFASPLYAQVAAAGAGITNSVHDLSDDNAVGTGSAVSNNEGTFNPANHICEVCHAPHNATTAQPLWDHDTAVGSTFSPYVNASIQATDLGNPGGVSLLCLSCHDGATNIAGFDGGVGIVVMGDAATNYPTRMDFGTDLTNDHPISFTYGGTLATADGQLHDPTATLSGLGLNIDDDMLFGTGNDQVECASCHDVHNGPGTVAMLLVKANTASALCLTCHNK